jgi:hypothetical protein
VTVIEDIASLVLPVDPGFSLVEQESGFDAAKSYERSQLASLLAGRARSLSILAQRTMGTIGFCNGFLPGV